MSDMEERKRGRTFFTELASILFLLGLIVRLIVGGFSILILSEMFFFFSDSKPGWLLGMETFYGGVWVLIKTVFGGAMTNKSQSPGQPQAAQINPACIVELVQFDGAKETARRRFYAKDLVARITQRPAKGVDWQEVQIASGLPTSEVGWVAKSEWNAARTRSDCG